MTPRIHAVYGSFSMFLCTITPTKKISEAQNPESFNEHMEVARKGGSIAKDARLKLEQETGEKVVTPLNAKDVLGLQSGEVEDVDLDSEESK